MKFLIGIFVFFYGGLFQANRTFYTRELRGNLHISGMDKLVNLINAI